MIQRKEKMKGALAKKQSPIEEKIDWIIKKAPILKANRDLIELDPENEQHKEWYEKDKY